MGKVIIIVSCILTLCVFAQIVNAEISQLPEVNQRRAITGEVQITDRPEGLESDTVIYWEDEIYLDGDWAVEIILADMYGDTRYGYCVYHLNQQVQMEFWPYDSDAIGYTLHVTEKEFDISFVPNPQDVKVSMAHGGTAGDVRCITESVELNTDMESWS